jgi:outer membrane receptor protein involved in Fe transport
VVVDAFTGGGAQADLVRTESRAAHGEPDSVRGHNTIQTGFQLPDWSRAVSTIARTSGGPIFQRLVAYAAGQSYAFMAQRGNGNLALLEAGWRLCEDDRQARPNLTLSLGVRYDWQNYFHDDNVAPRASFAYAPPARRGGRSRRCRHVHRSERPGHHRGTAAFPTWRSHLHVITQPTYPNPPVLSGAAEPPSITRLAPGVQIPRTLQYSLNVDGQVRKGLTLSIGYTGARGHDLFRSRDVNAPPPPLFLARPDPAYGAIRQIESTGRQSTDSLQLTLRGQVTRWFNGQTQYTLSHAWNDTNGLGFYPANDYDLSGEWARADFDRRHRLVLLGRVTPAQCRTSASA